MNTGEIITKGTTGIAGSVLAVLSPYQEHMEWAIQVLGGLLGIVRHILTFGGGFMTQAGIASDDQVTTGVSAIVTLVGLVWSVLNKKK